MSWSLSHLSIRARITLLVILASVPGFVTGVTLTLQHRQSLVQEAESAVANRARMLADSHYARVAQARRTLELLSSLPPASITARNCSALLQRFMRVGGFANVGIVNTRGDVVCGALQPVPDLNVSDRMWFKRVIATRDFAVGEFQYGRITGIPVWVAGLPIHKHIAFVALGAMPPAGIGERSAELLPEGATVAVIDNAGTILSGYPETVLPGTHLSTTFLDTIGQDHVFLASGIDQTKRLYGVADVSMAPTGRIARVIYGVPIASINADYRAFALLVALLFFGSTALIAALAWWGTAAAFTRQAKPILSVARRIAAADYSARAPNYPVNTEPAIVASALNQMAETLQEKSQRVEEYLARIERLNCLHTLLSVSGSAILRARTKDELLSAVCTTAASSCGLSLVWAGSPRNATLSLFASAGAAREQIVDRFSNDDLMRAVTSVAAQRTQTRVLAARTDDDAPLTCLLYPLHDKEAQGVLTFCAESDELFDEQGQGLFNDIAANVNLGLNYIEKEQQLQYLANYDALTGLPNRSLFNQRLAAGVTLSQHGGRMLAVGLLSPKGLDDIQYSHGYGAGDQVIRRIASCLAQILPDALVIGHLSRSEFGFVLDRADPVAVASAADTVLAQCPRSIELETGERIYLWYGLGISLYPIDGTNADDLVRNAQSATHSAAMLEQNSIIFFSPSLEKRAKQRLHIEHELRESVDRDELSVCYQPVIETATRKIRSLEALVRWNSPRLGSVLPGTFIPIAEQIGMIAPIGEWVIKKVCEEVSGWSSSPPALSVAVNVSVHQLQHPEHIARLIELLSTKVCHMPGGHLAIEITESELMRNVGVVRATLDRFKEMGISIYIDDFGTGYSSLNYLRRLPVDILKIDQSFVSALGKDSEAEIIVRGMITMAHELGFGVIAEGVETQVQFDILAANDCDYAQGYLFHKAVRGDEVSALISELR